MEYYLAVDIGASSGRHILGCIRDGRIELEEVYRFDNNLSEKNGHLCWDLEQLFQEILKGLKCCGELGKAPASMGVDTWGVDFVLLDKQGNSLGDAVAYRDARTDGMDAAVSELIPPEELYSRTGIQKQSFNTIYQLMAIKKQSPEFLKQASRLLMIPEYFHWRLTGKAVSEYTNATTTQLVRATDKDWDWELIKRLGYPERLFGKLAFPGTEVGEFSPEVCREAGFSCKVVLPGTHDTASAVLAAPLSAENAVYISSGTWSLIGQERLESDCSEESRLRNFTNEGGYEGRFRYLKNIMGLWMVQSVRRERKAAGENLSFDDLCELAQQAGDFPSLVDVSDECFLAPDSMEQAVDDFCARTGQPIPATTGERMLCIYRSLAYGYRKAVEELESLTGKVVPCIHIVGGGSKDWYLNRLTADVTGKTVCVGPTEATALGNVLAQMLAAGIFTSVKEARQAVAASFAVETIESSREELV